MRPLSLLFILLLSTNHLFAQISAKDFALLNSVIPKDSVELFGKGYISTHLNEYNITFSPKGDVILFTIANNTYANRFYTIFEIHKNNDQWTKPKIASFSGRFSDADPFFAPDGSGVYFISTRPKLPNIPKEDFDIWFVSYKNKKFGIPEHLGNIVNSENDELYPSVSKNGNIYFSTENGSNGYDLMMSELVNKQFQKPVALKGSINTKVTEFDAVISPDESYIIYTNMGDKDNIGSGDLYISFNKDGYWVTGQSLGNTVNTIHMEQCPIISGDGQFLFFTSFRDSQPYNFEKPIETKEYLNLLNSPLNGLGNIFWIDLKHLLEKINK